LTTYESWIAQFDSRTASDRLAWRRTLRSLRRHPLISVLLPVYNPDLEFLRSAVASVRAQIYEAWELCIADDASTDVTVRPFLEEVAHGDDRIRLTFREKNGHIAACSNTTLELARGEWCALLDQDDVFAEHALAAIACEIEQRPDAGLIYSDEDKIDAEGVRSDPFFKNDWDPERFLAQNFINHLGVYRTSLLREIGGFREGFEGSQDYDVALRCVERLGRGQVRHVPRILYHWRMAERSVARDPNAKPYALEAARRAITDHLERRGVAARVEACPEAADAHRVIYELPNPRPLVSIVIPIRDEVGLLKQCMASLEQTDYAPTEVVIVDNGSVDERTHDFLRELSQRIGARVVRDDGAFNFSRLINRGAATATGEVLALLNNDIAAEEPGWLREMVSHALQPGVGAVGARLWFPEKGGLQHGGVVLGLGGIAGHAFHRARRGEPRYFKRMLLQQQCAAVTAACMVLRRDVFESVGGFNEEDLPSSFNDIDFCLRLRARGLQNVWTPYANLIHHESASRGYHITPEEQTLFFRESIFMQEKWAPELLRDPFYNPNLTLDWPGFDLAFPPRV